MTPLQPATYNLQPSFPHTRIGRILKPQKNRPQTSILAGDTTFELQPQGWEHLK